MHRHRVADHETVTEYCERRAPDVELRRPLCPYCNAEREIRRRLREWLLVDAEREVLYMSARGALIIVTNRLDELERELLGEEE